MPDTVGIIGTGAVGGALARRAHEAGWVVVVSNSRGPASLEAFARSLGASVRADTPEGAARASDVVVVATPLQAVTRLPRAALDGKVVVDTTNYVPARDQDIALLDSRELTSSQLVQQHLPEARVVKAFNNIAPHHLLALARPCGASDRSALPTASDHPDATARARDLLDALGFDAVDLGPLADSWRSEPNSPLYALPYAGPAPTDLPLPEVLAWFQTSTGAPLTTASVEGLAATAVRGPAGVRF